MITKIQLRRDTGSNWASNNPVLALGEVGLDLTAKLFKVGDGSNNWNNLPYFKETVALAATQQEVEAGTSTTTFLTPNSIQFMVLDGGEFN